MIRIVRQLIVTALAMMTMAGSAGAQGTVMPIPRTQWLNSNGAVVSLGTLTVYEAGTTTLINTYSCVGLTLGCVNPNPIPLNASGRPSVSGVEVAVFLTPGQSYKFVLKNSTGSTLWTQDNISAVPSSNVNVDFDGTAGEDIAAGSVVYLSNGSGGKVAGQWYLADADFTYANATPTIGMAPLAIASGATGAIRIQGRVEDLSGLIPGSTYYVSATAGALTATAPTDARIVGQADGITSLVVAPNPPGSTSIIAAVVDPRIKTLVNGRLTLTTNVPVTTADVTAATTVYFTPYQGNVIALYTGSTWTACTFAQVSIAVPATTATVYDVFFDYNDACASSVLAVTAWTNDTTRATALTTQDGIYVKTGDTQQRYLGSFRTTTVSGQTEDSAAKRWLYNYYNRVATPMLVADASTGWTYTTATWRQSNATATNQVDVIQGVAESAIELEFLSYARNNTGGGMIVNNGIGEDSTTVPTVAAGAQITTTDSYLPIVAKLVKVPAVGRHFYAMLEASQNSGSTAFTGTNGTTAGANTLNSMLRGVWFR